jgi:hypothetical protein
MAVRTATTTILEPPTTSTTLYKAWKTASDNERRALHPRRRAYLLRGPIGSNRRPLEALGNSGESTEPRRRGRARERSIIIEPLATDLSIDCIRRYTFY